AHRLAAQLALTGPGRQRLAMPHRSGFRAFIASACRGHRRQLHSVPTRRSSDLTERNSATEAKLRSAWIPPAVAQAPIATSTLERSEEHTSELQSRENLVCRRLLEKQKPGRVRGGAQPNEPRQDARRHARLHGQL